MERWLAIGFLWFLVGAGIVGWSLTMLLIPSDYRPLGLLVSFPWGAFLGCTAMWLSLRIRERT